MTYEVTQRITIGTFAFTRSNYVEVKKSADVLSDTAVIRVPISAVLINKGQTTMVETAKAIKVGDAVTIELGYLNPKESGNYTEFNGYVKQINPGIPLEIVCEDKIWLLRRKRITKSWKATTLKEVLQEIVSGTGIELADGVPIVNLAPFYLKDTSGNFALQKIKDEYGLTVYIDNAGKLYAGLAYADNNGTVKYTINGNNTNVVDADGLKWRNKDDVRIKVKAVAINGNNTRTEVEFGDEEGSLKTLHFYNVATKAELERIAKAELDKMKFDGYEGKIQTLLLPYAEPGMKATVKDAFFDDRSGTYYIQSVTTTADVGGYNREVELGIKL
jgi:hypothetical protein